MINGFNIVHQNMSNDGITFYTPSMTSPALIMLPIVKYTSNCIVNEKLREL